MSGEGGEEKPPGKSWSGIPEAIFVVSITSQTNPLGMACVFFLANSLKAVLFQDDVDAYMALPENDNNADKVLRRLDEQHNKYKFMELNLLSKKRKLKGQIPDLLKSVEIVDHLEEQQKEGKEAETEFLMSDQVYMKAVIPPTDKASHAAHAL